MNDNEEVLYELKPEFNLVYEIMMPSGKKVKKSLTASLILLIFLIFGLVFKGYFKGMDSIVSSSYNILVYVIIATLVISFIILIMRIMLQVLEYRGIRYKFYKEYMIYENSFLNQTRKTVEYSNIKEVEIRRSVLDRIMNYGIIVIYTNAEKEYGSAMVIYAINNTQSHYDKINSIVRKMSTDE